MSHVRRRRKVVDGRRTMKTFLEVRRYLLRPWPGRANRHVLNFVVLPAMTVCAKEARGAVGWVRLYEPAETSHFGVRVLVEPHPLIGRRSAKVSFQLLVGPIDAASIAPLLVLPILVDSRVVGRIVL